MIAGHIAGGQGAITDGTLPSPSSTRWLATAVIVLGLLLAAATWRWWETSSTKIEPRHLIRFDIRPPDKTALATAARPSITISPDDRPSRSSASRMALRGSMCGGGTRSMRAPSPAPTAQPIRSFRRTALRLPFSAARS